MQTAIVFLLALVAVAVAAEGQFYVPRAYYTIDAEGHASPPVSLRRLRRSFNPYPYYNNGANADATAINNGGGSANARATAISGGSGEWAPPSGRVYGASNPLSAGQTRRQAGLVLGGRSVTASTSVGLDSSGQGYYDQYTSVGN